MVVLDRTDSTVIGRWWWTVDRWMLVAIALLMALGVILITTASPAVVLRIRNSDSVSEFYFVQRHLMMLVPAIAVMFLVSLLSPLALRRLSVLVLVGGLLGVLATLFVGQEIKGATRWLAAGGLNVQPSEFVKPAFAVVAAAFFAQRRAAAFGAVTLLLAIVLALLVSQPDLGMAVVVTAVWSMQFFVAGLPMVLVVGLILLAGVGLVGSYELLDHVRSRIDRFLDPAAGDNYQVDRSIEAFTNGGLFGTGPGEGTVKLNLPDAHADFIFAVGGEEFGLLACLLIVGLFAFLVVRGFNRVRGDNSLFVMLAVAGLVTQFGLQALINMASTLHLIPTKGMTLPFVSYGGSSLIALGYGMGMVLALTRRHIGAESRRW
jgi:cell division protein FtsW